MSENLTKPLLENEDYMIDFEAKKIVAKLAHYAPEELKELSDNENSIIRRRQRSMSMLTDPDEFNDVRKMNPSEYFYLHLWGENLVESDSTNENLIEDDTWSPEELLKLKLAEPEEK